MDVYIIIYIIYIYLVGGLEHDWIMTFHSVGNVIFPTDFHSIIFQRGRLKPPDSYPLVNIQKTMENHDFQQVNPL